MFYVPFNIMSVISGRWKDEHERVCNAMKCRLGRSATRTLLNVVESTKPQPVEDACMNSWHIVWYAD